METRNTKTVRYGIYYGPTLVGYQKLKVDKIVEPAIQRLAIEEFKDEHPIWQSVKLTAIRKPYLHKDEILGIVLLSISIISLTVLFLNYVL